MPQYPRDERRRNRSGEVLFRVTVGDNKRFESWEIVRSTSPSFAEAASSALARHKDAGPTLPGVYFFSVVFTTISALRDDSRPATLWIVSVPVTMIVAAEPGVTADTADL